LIARSVRDHDSSSQKDLIRLDREESVLVRSNDLCRLATKSSSGWPHCVPVSYVYLKGKFFVPANRASRKVINIERNSKATLLIDEGESKEHGIMIECNATVLYGSGARKMRIHEEGQALAK